jgi:hypothetical protein
MGRDVFVSLFSSLVAFGIRLVHWRLIFDFSFPVLWFCRWEELTL